jgi:hypothetical protein
MNRRRRSTRFAPKAADSNNQLAAAPSSFSSDPIGDPSHSQLKELPGLAGFGDIFLNLAPRFARLVIDA